MQIGFIGLGIMGRPMAGHLVKAGHSLFVNTIGPVPAELVEAGVKVCATGREVAQHGELIVVMVPDTADVEAVLFSKDGVADGLFARKIEEHGCQYLDAPVSGGEVGAKAASLTIMVGGPQAAFDKVRPIFELMGKNVTLVGGNGDGQTTKVANQIIVALTIEAVGEALLFASKAGAD